jgi:hypothetical protein
MLPESQEAHQVRLYRASSFPDAWMLVSIPLEGISAVDSIIFECSGRWWLLTSIDSSGSGAHGSETHLYFSNCLESNQWTPHPKNPVVSEASRGRNAGLIAEGGRLFRVFQEPGFGTYGRSVGVSEIKQITATSYMETAPVWRSNSGNTLIPRIHTVSVAEGLVAIDLWQRRAWPGNFFSNTASHNSLEPKGRLFSQSSIK